MGRRLVMTLIMLPGTAVVFVPAGIVWLTAGGRYAAEMRGWGDLLLWAGVVVGAAGLGLSTWSAGLFFTFGEGTPAPWAPPKRFVVRGPYRYVRNPMITGVLMILCAEAIVLQSWPIAAWMAVFFCANAVYLPVVEEKGLEERFGAEYAEYKRHVGRWIPRLRPWGGS